MTNREWERRTAVIEYKHHLEDEFKDFLGSALIVGWILHVLEVWTR